MACALTPYLHLCAHPVSEVALRPLRGKLEVADAVLESVHAWGDAGRSDVYPPGRGDPTPSGNSTERVSGGLDSWGPQPVQVFTRPVT